MRALWLADALRAEGLTVIEVPGWRDRGKELRSIKGVVAHHTATGTNWSDQRTTDLLRVGRSDLPGPLSQLGLDRQGRFHLVAAGRSNHNGYGTWGNDSIGIEAYNAGDGKDPWPAAQVDAYQRGAAAILRRLGLPAANVKGHKETDPKRKPDPRGLDMAVFRARVASLLTTTPAPITPPTPAPERWLTTVTPDEERALIQKINETHFMATAVFDQVVRDADDGGEEVIHAKLDRIEHALGSKHPDMVGEGTALVRLLNHAARNDPGNKPAA